MDKPVFNSTGSHTSSDISTFIEQNIQAVEAELATPWWAPDDPACSDPAWKRANARSELLEDLDRSYRPFFV
jgi:hypothetical protein